MPTLSIPTTSPSAYPSYDCLSLQTITDCRQNSCAWSDVTQTCGFECVQEPGILYSDIPAYAEFTSNAKECEILCLEDELCITFVYLMSQCNILHDVSAKPASFPNGIYNERKHDGTFRYLSFIRSLYGSVIATY